MPVAAIPFSRALAALMLIAGPIAGAAPPAAAGICVVYGSECSRRIAECGAGGCPEAGPLSLRVGPAGGVPGAALRESIAGLCDRLRVLQEKSGRLMVLVEAEAAAAPAEVRAARQALVEQCLLPEGAVVSSFRQGGGGDTFLRFYAIE